MAATPEQIKQLLDELKMYYANIFVLMEQALVLDPTTQFKQIVELNSRIQSLMTAVAEKSSSFQRAVHDLSTAGQPLKPPLNVEVEDFCETLPRVLQPLIDRLRSSSIALHQERGLLKEQLLKIQQSHKGLGGYKLGGQKSPKYLDSKI